MEWNRRAVHSRHMEALTVGTRHKHRRSPAGASGTPPRLCPRHSGLPRSPHSACRNRTRRYPQVSLILDRLRIPKAHEEGLAAIAALGAHHQSHLASRAVAYVYFSVDGGVFQGRVGRIDRAPF